MRNFKKFKKFHFLSIFANFSNIYEVKITFFLKLVEVAPAMITIVYGSILRPSSNNWASYRRLKWQIAALFL
jgi:hypothetical protein